jgi:CheY-like chemotaxis protein
MRQRRHRGTRNILVVDDEAAVRGIWSTLLERSGYAVTAVATAQLALHDLAGGPGLPAGVCAT